MFIEMCLLDMLFDVRLSAVHGMIYDLDRLSLQQKVYVVEGTIRNQ